MEQGAELPHTPPPIAPPTLQAPPPTPQAPPTHPPTPCQTPPTRLPTRDLLVELQHQQIVRLNVDSRTSQNRSALDPEH